VGFVDEDVDVRARVEIRRHVAELVDHRHDDAPVVATQQLVEPGDATGVLQVALAERGEVLEHLIFQLVAVDHQEDGITIALGLNRSTGTVSAGPFFSSYTRTVRATERTLQRVGGRGHGVRSRRTALRSFLTP